MNDTPRTNEMHAVTAQFLNGFHRAVPADHARTLERELNAATALVRRMREMLVELENVDNYDKWDDVIDILKETENL